MGQAVAGYLFGEAGFSLPRGGRSGLPAGAHLDHPGVWEDARLGRDSDVLIGLWMNFIIWHPAEVCGVLKGNFAKTR